MRCNNLVVPAAVLSGLAALLGGCASPERVVYVPASSSGTMFAADQLGMQSMHAQGLIGYTPRQSSPVLAFNEASVVHQGEGLIAAAQSGFVTMSSNSYAMARKRESNIRMPLVTFAATDGPSAD